MKYQKTEPSVTDCEVRRITVRRMTAYLYTSMYLSFGWSLEQTSVPVSRPIYIELCFLRKNNVRDSGNSQNLWREFDAAVGEIEAQERIQTSCTRKAVLFGLSGIVLLAIALFTKWFAFFQALQMLVALAGVLICSSAFFFYCTIYKRQADEFAENLCENYQKIYTLCQQTAELLKTET